MVIYLKYPLHILQILSGEIVDQLVEEDFEQVIEDFEDIDQDSEEEDLENDSDTSCDEGE